MVGLKLEELRACHVLGFLQKGLEMGLSTMKGQVSAISVFTGIQWDSNDLMTQFFKAVVKLRPPRVPTLSKWGLPLVLNFLTSPKFSQGVNMVATGLDAENIFPGHNNLGQESLRNGASGGQRALHVL